MGKWDAGFQKPPRFYVHRNYALFAMLADVRNKPPGNLYYITPISEPRGVPEDANKRALAFMGELDMDGHSHSHFTLAELQTYDWKGQTRTESDVLYEETYRSWRETGSFQWPFDGNYGKREIISNEEMDARIAARATASPEQAAADLAAETMAGVKYATEVTYRATYAQLAGEFYDKVMPDLATLGAPEDVRILFFFDN
jgi:hypothetical protein